jgi:hypothetical protein
MPGHALEVFLVMVPSRKKIFVWMTIAVGMVGLLFSGPTQDRAVAQEPTGTVSNTTEGPSGGEILTVIGPDGAKVRTGPNTVGYPEIGRLQPGDQVVALGKSPLGEWILISFPSGPGGVGWVYSYLVSQPTGTLRIVEPPPTATPLTTATIDPTLAAQFVTQPTATRLPTFTPPPPLTIPTYGNATGDNSGMPVALVILSLGAIGLLGVLVSLFGRR